MSLPSNTLEVDEALKSGIAAIANQSGLPPYVIKGWCEDACRVNSDYFKHSQVRADLFTDLKTSIQKIVDEKAAVLAFEAFRSSVAAVAKRERIPEEILAGWCSLLEEKIPYIFNQVKYSPHNDKDDVKSASARIRKSYEFLHQYIVSSGILQGWRGKSQSQPQFMYNLSGDIVVDVAVRIQRDKARFTYFHDIKENEVDPYKVGGFFMYWIAKLKPVNYIRREGISLSEQELYLNEYLAIIAGVTRADQQGSFKPIPPKIFSDLAYNLRYRSYSSDDLILLLRTLLPEG